jgi:PAS domain S-box-containing protein
MEFLDAFWSGGYLAHGYCITWKPGLLWSMVGSDAIIAAAYFSIPLAIASFVRRRGDASLNWLAGLFSAFIFACGITHVMDIWTIWRPDYGLQAIAKMLTAAVSLITAVALWPLIPRALKIPTVGRLQGVIDALQTEIRMRHGAEDHLIEVEQSLSLTLAGFGAGFIAVDRAGRLSRMNAVAEEITGWPEAEARGRIAWEVFQREDRPAAYLESNPVEILLQEGVTMQDTSHVVAVSRSGRRTTVEVKADLTRAADQSVRGMVWVFRDISRLIEAQTESSRLAAIVESSLDAIIGTTLDGHITSWNEGAQGVFGYSAEETVGRSVRMLIPPDRADEEMRLLAEVAGGRRVPAFDTRRRAKDGTVLDVSLTISPVRDAQGRIVGGAKIARNVGEQRRAERALRDSQLHLRFVLDAAQIGEWDADLATGTVTRSLQHDRCFGYETMVPDWNNDIFISHVHPDDRADAVRKSAQFIGGAGEWEYECRVIWPDGGVHWIRLHGSTVSEGGKPVRLVGIIADITQSKLTEEARVKSQRLEAENHQIQEASRLKSQFLANMSHELRTPLNAIIGFADLLHSGAIAAGSPQQMEFLGYIGTSGRHLLQLINDVLDLSKVEAGKLEFFPEPVDLQALAKEVKDILLTAIQQKHIDVSVEVDPALPLLSLDPSRLKQVLFNYLSNAIKFTPDGGRVTIRARREGLSHVRIEVADTGIGIAAADLPRLFSEFQQLDAGLDKQHQGTGLGLALTRRLVEAQGGTVGVSSVVGRGSVFHLVLNLVHGSDIDLGATQARDELEATAKRRLLVIDGGRSGQNRHLAALADAGFAVDAPRSGEQAVQFAEQRSYDGITLNLELPGEPGLGVLANIRRHGASREVPVVGVSMPAPTGDPAAFAVADVLSKPLIAGEVLAAMAPFRFASPRVATVMVIDDDAGSRELMRATLVGLGIVPVCMSSGREALVELGRRRPDAIILDLLMPEFDGFAVLDALNSDAFRSDVPVFIWTSMLLSDADYARLARSAQAIIAKGGGTFSTVLEKLRRRYPPGGGPRREDALMD